MHKVRENNNGSFSVGKTWVLDDLSAIQSYSNLVPTNLEEQQAKERAGGTGFVITIQKPYYWQASTPKEKDFFIFSLIKIYKKYTAGKLPQLVGFEASELEQLGGSTVGSPAPPNRPSPRAPSAPGVPRVPGAGMINGSPSPDPSTLGGERLLTTPQLSQNRDTSRDRRERPSQEHRPSQERTFIPNGDPRSRPIQEQRYRSESEARPRPSQESSLRNESEMRSRPSQERVLRRTDSDDRIPAVPGQFPSSDFVRNLRPQASQNHMNGKRSDSPSGSSGLSGELAQPQSNLRKIATAQSTESFRNTSESQSSRYQSSSQRPSEERIRPNGLFTGSSRSDSSEFQRPSTSSNSRAPSNLSNGSVPEGTVGDQAAHYQRPPTSAPLFNQSQNGLLPGTRANFPSVLSPGFRGHELQRPSEVDDSKHRDAGLSRSDNQPQTSLVNGNHTQNATEQSPQPRNEPSLPETVKEKLPNEEAANVSNPPPSTPEPQPEEEVHRPGLGPMIKAKKSNKEIASTFRKAATSYNAFKPRAGGAAEKLQNAKEGPGNEPDGVTGVVPAPSLLRGASQDQVKSPNLDQARTDSPVPTDSVQQQQLPDHSQPATKSSSPEMPRQPPVVRISTPPTKRPSSNEAPRAESLDVPPSPPEKDERRRKRKSDHSAKYAKALGIHPNLLEGRTFEIESVLNDFGWGEESTERNTFDELQSGIRKELARVEAGSWLGVIENHDERISAVGEMMDRVIVECEEFDCLLTLYNVELGVSEVYMPSNPC